MGPLAYILGPIFFTCLFIAGLTSLISLLESLIAPFIDLFNVSRKKVLNAVVILGLLISLCFATSYADVSITTVDNIANNIALIILIAIECIIFCHKTDIDALVEVLNKNTLIKINRVENYC